ncbi:GDSL-type esterase/lipase family protein [Streptomyces sp. Ac-502]|uniref:GDSL-type esterase/lipase family protein n=1 Tax=Streptomyces sp. Ac-502 TaxID=3342801 RepID=UPI003862AC38
MTARRLIDAHRTLIRQAHAHGLKAVGLTILPVRGAVFPFTDAVGDKVRQELNTWIRTSGAYDTVLDAAHILTDPTTGRTAPGYVSEDGLHPSDAGYAALASAVNLNDLYPPAPSPPPSPPSPRPEAPPFLPTAHDTPVPPGPLVRPLPGPSARAPEPPRPGAPRPWPGLPEAFPPPPRTAPTGCPPSPVGAPARPSPAAGLSDRPGQVLTRPGRLGVLDPGGHQPGAPKRHRHDMKVGVPPDPIAARLGPEAFEPPTRIKLLCEILSLFGESRCSVRKAWAAVARVTW